MVCLECLFEEAEFVLGQAVWASVHFSGFGD